MDLTFDFMRTACRIATWKCCQAHPKLQLCCDELSFNFDFPDRESTVTWNLSLICLPSLFKEDNLTGRRPHMKTTSQEDALKGRQLPRKTTSMEDNLNERWPQWTTTSIEDELNWRRPQWRMTSMLKNNLIEVDLNGSLTGIIWY